MSTPLDPNGRVLRARQVRRQPRLIVKDGGCSETELDEEYDLENNPQRRCDDDCSDDEPAAAVKKTRRKNKRDVRKTKDKQPI